MSENVYVQVFHKLQAGYTQVLSTTRLDVSATGRACVCV